MDFIGKEVLIKMRERIKIFLAAGICLVMVLVSLSGCVQEAKSIKNPNMIVNYTIGDPKTLDPADAYDSASIDVINQIYDRLVMYKGGDTTTFYPALAVNWTVSDDSKNWTFHLREGVKFSNGNPFTAEDVKYSFDRVLIMNSPESGVAWILSQCMDLNSTKVLDDYTVQITLTQPYGGFLALMAFSVASIVDKETVEAHGGVVADTENQWMKENAVGTGPYKLDHWTHKTELVLVKNDYYWGGWDGNHVEKVVIKIAEEAATRILALKNGDADFAYIPLLNVEDVKGAEGISYDVGPSYNVVLGILNTKSANEFMANSKVRKALSYVFNYDSAIKDAYNGYLARLPGAIPKGMPYYDTQNNGVPVYNYNITKAEEILDAAGYTKNDDGYRFNGTTFRIYYNAGNEERQKMALSFQQELDKIGIVSSVTSEGWPQLLHRMFSTTDWDFIFMGWMPDYNDPDDYIYPFIGSADIEGDTFNHGWKNETVDELILKAKYSADPKVREDAYRDAFQIYINDPPIIFVGQNMQVHFQRDWVQGYEYNPIVEFYYYDYYKAHE